MNRVEGDVVKLPPIEDTDWPPSLEDLRQAFAGGLNVYRTMAHHPALLLAWAPLRDHLVVHTSLGKQFSEIVILRTGARLGSSYEWAHHVSRGRACGLTDRRIASTAGPVEEMETHDRILAAAVDELLDGHMLSLAVQQQLVSLVGKIGLLDLIATVGFYATLGAILKSFEVPIEPAIAAELHQNPLAG